MACPSVAMETRKKVALIIGGTGISGCEIAPMLLNKNDDPWDEVLVVSRSSIDPSIFSKLTSRKVTPVTGVSLDDKATIVKALRATNTQITHMFWFVDAASIPSFFFPIPMRFCLHYLEYVGKQMHLLLPRFIMPQIYTWVALAAGSGPTPRNIVWLRNAFDALNEVEAPFERMILGTGAKHYGMHLGPTVWPEYTLPFREDGPTPPGNMSYYEMERFIKSKASSMKFSLNVIRPGFILGLPPKLRKGMQNLGLAVALYCTIQKAKGNKLVFPGNYNVYNSVHNISTSRQIARIATWAADGGKKTENESYNVLSCKAFIWKDVWLALADYFGMEAVGPTKIIGAPHTHTMGSKKSCVVLWNKIVQEHNLQQLDFETVFNPIFFNKTFSFPWDAVFSDRKLLEHGIENLYEVKSANQAFTQYMDRLIDERVIPDPRLITSTSNQHLLDSLKESQSSTYMYILILFIALVLAAYINMGI